MCRISAAARVSTRTDRLEISADEAAFYRLISLEAMNRSSRSLRSALLPVRGPESQNSVSRSLATACVDEVGCFAEAWSAFRCSVIVSWAFWLAAARLAWACMALSHVADLANPGRSDVAEDGLLLEMHRAALIARKRPGNPRLYSIKASCRRRK